MPSNDNSAAVHAAEGPAALLLVESLIHELCAKAVITTAEAVSLAERAASLQHEWAEAAGGAGTPPWRSHALLETISMSLAIDMKKPPSATDKASRQ